MRPTMGEVLREVVEQLGSFVVSARFKTRSAHSGSDNSSGQGSNDEVCICVTLLLCSLIVVVSSILLGDLFSKYSPQPSLVPGLQAVLDAS